jgi:hypothetical protein
MNIEPRVSQTRLEQGRQFFKKCTMQETGGLSEVLLQSLREISVVCDEVWSQQTLDPDNMMNFDATGTLPDVLNYLMKDGNVEQMVTIDRELKSQGFDQKTLRYEINGAEAV